MSRLLLVPSLLAASAFVLPAQQGEPERPAPEAAAQPEAGGEQVEEEAVEEEATRDPAAGVEQFLARFHPKVGTVGVGEYATVALADGWRWLDGPDAQAMLVAFGNMQNDSVRGVAIPPDFADSGVFAVYVYSDDGHVEDDEPDYAELLDGMKEDAREGSKQRKKAGLQAVELVGWAEPPHYDRSQHKLYFAKELRFEGEPESTLNYNVRVLGRTGTMEINGVGGISQLPLVAQHMKELLRVTEFVDGQRYTDFDPAYDKVAAYGIGGLIAGKVALKAGLFAKLALLLKAFLKPLLVGVAILGGVLWKVLGGRRQKAEEQAAQ